jgi:hypothetical protein
MSMVAMAAAYSTGARRRAERLRAFAGPEARASFGLGAAAACPPVYLEPMRALAFACLILASGCGDTESSITNGTASGGSGTGTATAGSGGAGAATSTGPSTGGATTSGATGGGGGTAGAGGSGAAGGASGGGGGGGGGGAGGDMSAATSTSTGGMPGPCVWGDDCGGGYYCLAPGCGMGECVQKPIAAGQSPDPAPVCGCDGVTYWNEDVAASLGVSVATTGQCAMPIACGPGMDCPGGMKCNRQVADQASCNAAGTGECWGTAVSCPLEGPLGRACSNGQCELQCSLIQSQNPWFADPTCN